MYIYIYIYIIVFINILLGLGKILPSYMVPVHASNRPAGTPLGNKVFL